MTEGNHQIQLTLPATQEDLLTARMAVSGLGMLAGLDVDQIGDLRTVVNECCDCLLHRAPRPGRILLSGEARDGRLYVRFWTEESGEAQGDKPAREPLDVDVALAVLETLMPEVALRSDQGGVCKIECSMPIG